MTKSRVLFKQSVRDIPPVIVLVAVGLLDGLEGVTGWLVALGAYGVALLIWAWVGPVGRSVRAREREAGATPADTARTADR